MFKVLLLLVLVPLHIFCAVTDPDALIYNQSIQVTSEVDQYENIKPGSPIYGSVMITHNASSQIDEKSFKLGPKPLKVSLVQSVSMSSDSPVVVSIYRFQLEGMKIGLHNMEPITVNVGGKTFEAPPMTIQVGE